MMYDAIKQYCCLEEGISSHDVVANHINKQSTMSVVTKIAIQMACKLDDEAWRIHVSIGKSILCGFDVYHDSDRKVLFHRDRRELSQNFTKYVRNAIQAYMKKSGGKPKFIVIFRDGVGVGDISWVMEGEMKDTRKALEEFSDFGLELIFIIVTKRVNARFWKIEGANRVNCSPGTSIDNTVTSPNKYVFYLISQSVQEGTVTPTMYDVIAGDQDVKPAGLQELAYKLSHMYFNWQGAIKNPAPCQYAHKLAYLAGMSLHRAQTKDLANFLYYL